MATEGAETAPLLARNYAEDDETFLRRRADRIRAVISIVLGLGFLVGLGVVLFLSEKTDVFGGGGSLPKDPFKAALRILDASPVLDGHIDLPYLVRMMYRNNVSAVDLEKDVPGQVDIKRLRAGKVGGFFWSVYTDCPKVEDEDDFVQASWRVRDTLEQIDVATLLIDKYSKTFELARSTADIHNALDSGRIASLLGVEGAHQLGNSLHVLRQYYALGVRYVTLTHACHNAFADSGGIFDALTPLHNGLSPLGFKLIDEMNRLGMLVDLSHVSDATALQALEYSRAPVMWSHSSARAVHNVSRNVPDEILSKIGRGENQTDGVVMVNFAPYFVAPYGKADIKAVADHVDHIGKVAGRKHVGIGSDFDGIGVVPVGLEDVSKYPNLFAELYRRGWSRYDLAGLAGANFVRVFTAVEKWSEVLQRDGMQPAMDIYEKREDLPEWKEEL